MSLIFVFYGTDMHSQIKLSLLDGKQYDVNEYRLNDIDKYIEYKFIKSNGKINKGFADYDDIWSLNINGKDSMLYTQKLPEEYSVDEMRTLVLSRQYAIKEFNPWWAVGAGFIVGCGSLFLPLDPFSRIIIPIAYVGVMNFVKPSRSYVLRRYEMAAGNELFYYGYRDTARKKIFARSTAGVIGGVFVAGAIVGTLSLIQK